MDMEPSAGSFIPGPEMVPLDDVEILSSGAFGAGPRIMERYCEMLDKSCRFAYFESPYFIPAGPLLDAMKRAAERGVDVRVIYPARCDLSCVYDLCSASFVAEALESGVRIGQYAPGFLHSKMFVTDDIACVGSANLDSWSLCRNLEIMVFVHDASFADELLGHFRQDESLVTYLDETEWARRPFRQRVGERTWRILRHVL